MTKSSPNINNPAIDLEFLRGIIDNDKEFEKELFEIFVDNAKKNINKLVEAISADDNNAWYMASHAFKGAATSVGAFNLAEILENAQQSPEENSSAKRKILEKIKDDFDDVLGFIKNNIAS